MIILDINKLDLILISSALKLYAEELEKEPDITINTNINKIKNLIKEIDNATRNI